MRLAPSFGHGFGEVGKQAGEPEPERKLKINRRRGFHSDHAGPNWRGPPVLPTRWPQWLTLSGIRPASGMKLSCMAFTAPQEVPVVAVANSTLFMTPNRVSFPSNWGNRLAVTGFGCDSAHRLP
jgi:hypothetical protein